MKAITIKSCLDCPLLHMTEKAIMYCDSCAVVDKRKKKERYLGNFVTSETGVFNIPDWCPLTNIGSVVMGWMLDNGIKRDNISKPIHDLILKTE